ncbi:Mlp family lipoprotein (plasmid) [Borreliella yangtzensis]|uniref:Tfp pilus assembly protein PilP n=1 Tax=Borreliella yangtzensis TaxID=683292 RepID=A0ABR6PBV0_9SPIR|nr:Tfp pilus assembly protein PilP [Borreliella yangtzensis]
MKITNILFCLFLLMLNGCNSNDNDTLKNNIKQSQSRKKRDLSQEKSQQEIPKSPEELLREKLTEDQKTHLDWLKTALTDDGQFDKFLGNDEEKIKEALDHIKSELGSCNGDQADQQKTTFKTLVKAFFKNGDINSFNKDNVTSNCNN